MHPCWDSLILGSPQYPGIHMLHFSPPTRGLHSHCPVSGWQVSETLPNLLQLHKLGQPAPLGPAAAVLPSGQQPCHESEHFWTRVPWAESAKIRIYFFCWLRILREVSLLLLDYSISKWYFKCHVLIQANKHFWKILPNINLYMEYGSRK